MDNLNSDIQWLKACFNTSAAPLECPNWETLSPVLKQHRLIPYFYNWWIKNSSFVFADITELHQSVVENNKRNLLLISLTTQLEALCQKLGVRVLHLKGVSLAQRLYNSPTTRMCSDIDILVNLPDLPTLHRELQNLGYKCNFDQNIFESNPSQVFSRYKDLIYKHIQFNISLELHWKLESNPFLLNTNFEQLWARRSIVTINKQDLATLGDDDNLLYLAVHGAKHRWKRLHWLADWGRLQELTNSTLHKDNRSYQLAQCLWCKWFDSTKSSFIFSPQINSLAEYCNEIILNPRGKNPYKRARAYLCYYLNLEPSWRFRWFFVQQILNETYGCPFGIIKSDQSWRLGFLIYLTAPYYLLRRLLKQQA